MYSLQRKYKVVHPCWVRDTEERRKGVSRGGIPSIITLTCVTVSQPLEVLAQMPRNRSRTFKSKMGECDGSRFYCAFLWVQTLLVMRILQPLLKEIKKRCWQGGRVDILCGGSRSLQTGADQDTHSDVMFQVDCGGATCLLSGRCAEWMLVKPNRTSN